MNITDIYKIYRTFPKVVTDTRQISSDSLFFALKGENFNGNKFAKEALNKGAEYAIVDEFIEPNNDRIILVNNVLQTLQDLANYHRNQFSIPFIGITGTNGKTTTKELLNSVLSQKYKVLATEGNYNNHIGVPLTLLKLTEEHELAIIEMGANHPGEILELCKISEPNIGIVTNVGMAHLEGFGSFENIVETKIDLYRFVKANNGVNFLLKENTLIKEKLEGFSFVEYSIEDTCSDYHGSIDKSETLLRYTIKTLKKEKIEELTINTNLVGSYNQSNILSAIAIADYFNVELFQIKQALESYKPTNNRSQVTKTSKNSLILDAYNANPTSVMGALENFVNLEATHKVVILGDMFELGEFSNEKHQEVVDYISKQSFDQTILIGEAYYNTFSDNELISKYQKLETFIKSSKISHISDAIVLLKGSRGMGLEKLVEYL